MIEDLGCNNNIGNGLSNNPLPPIKNRLSLCFRSNKENTFQLNKIFFNNEPSSRSSHTSLFEKPTEKEREINLLEKLNFNTNKLNKEYLSKLSDLLQSKRDPEYAPKRKHIDKIIYQTDDNYNVYLTLPRNIKIKPKTLRQFGTINNTIKTETVDINTPQQRDIIKKPKKDIIQIIPEFNKADYQELMSKQDRKDQILDELKDGNDMSNLNEEEQMELFEKLRTKKGFYPIIETQSNINTTTDNNLTANDNKGNQLRIKGKDKDDKDVSMLYEVLDKYLDKARRLRELKKKKKKNYQSKQLEHSDLFTYNSKRWEDQRNPKNLALKKIELIKKKETTKKTLDLMADGYEKLSQLYKGIQSYGHNSTQHKHISNNDIQTFMTCPGYSFSANSTHR